MLDAENSSPNAEAVPLESAPTPKASHASYDAMDAAMARSIRRANTSNSAVRRSSSVRGVSPRLIAPTRSSSAKLKQKTSLTPAPASTGSTTARKCTPTIPTAPHFHAVSARTLPPSSEERLYQTIQNEAAAEAKRRQEYKKFYTSSIAVPASATTIRSAKPLTIPETPKFKTSQRLGEKQTAVAEASSVKASMVKPAQTVSGPTIPKPFHFATDARISQTTATISSVPSTAELVQQFTAKTRGPITTCNTPRTTTTPTSPIFQTAKRAQVVSRALPPSREEIEAKEAEEMKQYHFRANPVNPKIYGRANSGSSISSSGGVIGVPKVTARPTTTPTPFSLATESRAAHHKSAPSTSETPVASFKALPLPPTTSTPVVPQAPAPKPLTEPHSPKLHGATRASSAPPRRQLPHHSAKTATTTTAASHTPLTLTQPVEFHLQTSIRGSIHAAKLQSAKEAGAIAPSFHALPLPPPTEPFRPVLDGGHLTEVQEFHLSTPKPRAISAEEEKFEFHAKPLPSTTYAPSTIAKPEREPLVPQDVNLSTEQRLAKRREYDAKIAAKFEAEKREKEEKERAAQAAEAAELAKLRKLPISAGGMQFTATPILASDPYPVAAVTTKPLTEPHSPPLRTKQRTRIM